VTGPRFVLFDYGNTLVPFGRAEAGIVGRAAAEAVTERVQGIDPAAFARRADRVRDDLIRATRVTGREVTNAEFARALAVEAGLPDAPRGFEEELEARVGEAFVRVLRLPPDTLPVLDALSARRRLGLVSNFYLPRPLRRSLDRLGIRPRLSAAVISAEVGWVKPRPEPFLAALDALDADPRDCVFVGDNPAADVAGAAALGMRTVLTREWHGGALAADLEDAGGGPGPDLVVERLADLPAALETLPR
jgi:putative hydrolase of the HAD superfamily